MKQGGGGGASGWLVRWYQIWWRPQWFHILKWGRRIHPFLWSEGWRWSHQPRANACLDCLCFNFFFCVMRDYRMSHQKRYTMQKTLVHTWYIIIDRIADWNICLTAKVFHYNIWNFFYWSWFLTNSFFSLFDCICSLSLDRIRRHKFRVAIVDLFSWLLLALILAHPMPAQFLSMSIQG